jgi:hypothetical protein
MHTLQRQIGLLHPGNARPGLDSGCKLRPLRRRLLGRYVEVAIPIRLAAAIAGRPDHDADAGGLACCVEGRILALLASVYQAPDT